LIRKGNDPASASETSDQDRHSPPLNRLSAVSDRISCSDSLDIRKTRLGHVSVCAYWIAAHAHDVTPYVPIVLNHCIGFSIYIQAGILRFAPAEVILLRHIAPA
jgi:hypothetical protein